MKRPLLFIIAAFSMGILSRELLNIPVFFALGVVLISFALSVTFIRSPRKYLLFVFTGFLFLGAFDHSRFYLLPKDHIKNIAAPYSQLSSDIFVQGTIANRPYKKLTSFKQEMTEFLLDVEAVSTDDKWRSSCGLLSVRLLGPFAEFRYGQRVVLEGKLSVPRPAANPGQFDYRKFLERKKIFYVLDVKENNFSKIVGEGRKDPIKAFAYRIARRLEALIDNYSSPPEGAVLNAILIGGRREISDDVNDDFINTGTVHILSISGLHVGLLAFIGLLLFRVFRIPFKPSAVILAVLIVFYCIMVENRPPILRSAIMILVFLFGRFLKREQDGLNSLALAALLILFFNPQDLFDIGFQLSFLTIGAIIYISPKLEKMFDVKPASYIKRAAIVSFSAWLGGAPFIAAYFNIVSPVTLVANLVVVPWMFFVMASSAVFIALGSISSAFALIFSEVANLSVRILLGMVSVFAGLPFSYFRIKSPPWILIAGFYVFIILFFERRYLRLKAKYFLIAALVFINLFIWKTAFLNRRDLEITFLDVGRGDSIFVEFPRGGTMLIDGGEGSGPDMGRLVVSRFLAYKGINEIDAVVATHPHTDHVGGLASVLKNFRVRYFIDNGDPEENYLYRECRRIIKKRRIKKLLAAENKVIRGFENARLLVLNPPLKRFADANNDSMVMRLDHENFSVLFCGDIREEAVKNLLLRHGEELRSTVLKVPHHGARLGVTGSEFLGKVKPEVAVISSRGRVINVELLADLESQKAKVYRTETDGAVTIVSEKDKYSASGFIK